MADKQMTILDDNEPTEHVTSDAYRKRLYEMIALGKCEAHEWSWNEDGLMERLKRYVRG